MRRVSWGRISGGPRLDPAVTGNGVRRSVRVGRYETGYRDLHGAGPHAAAPCQSFESGRPPKAAKGELAHGLSPLGKGRTGAAVAGPRRQGSSRCPAAALAPDGGGPSFASPDGTGIEAQQILIRRPRERTHQDAIEMGRRSEGRDLRRSLPWLLRLRQQQGQCPATESSRGPLCHVYSPLRHWNARRSKEYRWPGISSRRREVEASEAKESFGVGLTWIKCEVGVRG